MLQHSHSSSPTSSEDAGHAAFVSAIGSAAAVELFLKFGGSTVYVPVQPQPGSRLVEAIGAEAVAALHRQLGRGHAKVPLANAWTARQLAARGVPRAEMCRLLRVSRTSLSGYLKSAGGPSPKKGSA